VNIIYIVVHDLGRHLGCHGAKVHTPNLDRFARENVQFNRAFCNSAVCSPSRGCAMTGLYAHNNGIVGLSHFGWRVHDHVKTLVDYFNEAGFETVHCGLSHEGEEGNLRYQIEHERTWASRNAENSFDDAITYLKNRQPGDPPFYLNIGTQEVHRCLWERDVEKNGQPSRLHSVYGGPVPDERVYLPPGTPDIPLFRDLFARFQPAVEFMDREIERLLRAIEETGHADNSLIVFTTDHGIFNLRGKGTLYDQGMATALLMRLPGKLKKQMTTDSLVQNIDLAPTLLEAAGVPVPDHLPGRSLWPLLTGGEYQPHEHIFTEWNFGGPPDDYNPIRAVRTERWHYLRNFNPDMPYRLLPDEIPPDADPAILDPGWGVPCMDKTRCQPPEELYDLRNDPLELDNLAGKPEFREVCRELGSEIDDWMHATDDFLLTGEKPSPPAPPGFGPLASH
jgi:arylsulfatase A-like enzyme